MSKSMKKITLSCLVALMVIAMAFATLSLVVNRVAFADGLPTQTETMNFGFQEGAEFRDNSDGIGYGIRFALKMDEEYFNALPQDAKLYVLVSIDETILDATSLTKELVETNNKVKMQEITKEFDFVEGVGTRYISLVYRTNTHVLDDVTVRAFVEYNGSVVYGMDNTGSRSMASIANYGYLTNQVEKELAEQYLGTINSVSEQLFEKEDGAEFTVNNLEGVDGAKIYNGVEKVNGSVVDGVLTIAANDVPYGDSVISVIGNGKTYNIKVACGDKAFTNENKAELVDTFSKLESKTNDGYYILGGDISDISFAIPSDLNGQTGTNISNYVVSNANTFKGTFDGRGYTISKISAGGLGLFGNFGGSATLKNVAFEDVTFTRQSNHKIGLLFNAPVGNGINVTLENVYVQVNAISKDLIDDYPYISVIAANTMSSTAKPAAWTINNVIIDAPYEEGFSLGSRVDRGGIVTDEANSFIDKSISNFYVINNGSKLTAMTYVEQDNVAEGIVAFPSYVKEYNTLADMKADTANTYTSFENEYWTVAQGGIPIWKNDVSIRITDSQGAQVAAGSILLTNGSAETYTLTLTVAGEAVDSVVTLPQNCTEIVLDGNVISAGEITEDKVIPVTVSYGESKKIINVSVSAAVLVDYATEVVLSVEDGKLHLPNEFADKTITEATYNGLSVLENGVISGVPCVIKEDRSDVEAVTLLVKFDDGSAYSMTNVKPYTLVFTNENKDVIAQKFASLEGKERNGYYILGENISDISFELSEAALSNSDIANYVNGAANIFKGVFDGKGYTIDGITASGFALFGNFGDGATIKNIAFTGVEFARTAKHRVGLLFNAPAADNVNVTLENVYVKTNPIKDSIFAVDGTAGYQYVSVIATNNMSCYASGDKLANWKINNVIIIAPYENPNTYDTWTNTGRPFRGGIITDQACNFGTNTVMTNFCVISDCKKVENMNKDYIEKESKLVTELAGKQFTSVAEMANKGFTYTSFTETGLWTIVDGIPSFTGINS